MSSQVAREILVKTRRKVFSQNLGNNATAFVGNGVDFSELREYHFGDDVRKINWKATARQMHPYINLFTEERELNVVVCFMVGGSIYFGSQRLKQEVMSEVLALLGYSVLKNSDRLSTLFFSDKEEYFRKPTKNISALNEIIPAALEIESLGKKVDYQTFSDHILHRVKQKSIIFIIGDFFEEVDFSLLSARHELYAIMIRDRFEENPALLGELDLIDPSTNDVSDVDFSEGLLKEFREEIEKKDQKLYEHFLAHDIRHTKIYTDEDPFLKLNSVVR